MVDLTSVGGSIATISEKFETVPINGIRQCYVTIMISAPNHEAQYVEVLVTPRVFDNLRVEQSISIMANTATDA